jgi:large subunit ribosomal protein L9
MKVILLKDVAKVGKKYDVKTVSDGYALNFLLPQLLAKIATETSLKNIDALKKTLEVERNVQEDLLSKNLHEVDGKTVEIKLKANEKGHLFAGLHKEELPKYIKASLGADIDPHFIELSKPIKEVGAHEIHIKALDKKAIINISVVADTK